MCCSLAGTLYRAGQRWESGLLQDLRNLARALGRRWVLRLAHVERVKSYAPRVWHLVADVHCAPGVDE